jgi:hypothetical protein
MLQEIKERAQGWVAWAIVILISIPFALWGIQSYLGVGGEPVVAKVGGTEITERQFSATSSARACSCASVWGPPTTRPVRWRAHALAGLDG